MTYFILMGLLWAIVVLAAALPVVLFQFLAPLFLPKELKDFARYFTIVGGFIGGALFSMFADVLLENETISTVLRITADLCFAATATVAIYMCWRVYRRQSG